MKPKYVPIDKQSKQKQKDFYARKRRDWGEISPVTKAVPNAKLYNRKKSKHRYEIEPGLDFLVYLSNPCMRQNALHMLITLRKIK